jgi:L-threonylcarbamoyladenylate synthase
MNDLIAFAAQKIKDNDVVAFPTETVYGLGANAFSDAGCRKIYALKSRPSNNPLIVHVSSLEQACQIGYFTENAIKIAKSFWPGPISIVVELKDHRISQVVTAGLNTIAIRIPDNHIALDLLSMAELPIAAPSANPSNYISPTLAEHVRRDFEDAGVTIIDGGPSVIGIESTIVDASIEDEVVILRPGFITEEDLKKIGVKVVDRIKSSIIAPGMMQKHYSPRTKLRLYSKIATKHEVALNFGQNIVIGAAHSLNLSANGNLEEAASNLYMMLRELDLYAQKNDIILINVANIPEEGIGIAINDKLKRAAC